MRKLQPPPKVKGVTNSKKTNHQTLQRLVSEQAILFFNLTLLQLEFKDDLLNFRQRSYTSLHCLKRIKNKKVMRFEIRKAQNEEK
jgi:hypothetical protein